MRKLNILLLVLLSTVMCLAQDAAYQTKTFNAESFMKVDIKTSGGHINVEGGAEKNATVKVKIKGNNGLNGLSKSEIEDRLQQYDLKIAVENNTLICEAKPKGKMDWRNSLSISFELKVPSEINLSAITSGGSISLMGLNGQLDFKTSGGSLVLENLKGNVMGKTSGGSISLMNGKGDVNLKTSGGSIQVENAKGDINLMTSGGSLNLKNLKGKVVAKTSGGSIRVDNADGGLDVATSGGGINLNQIKGNLSATTSGGGIDAKDITLGETLTLKTSSGNIHVDLPFNKGMDLNIKGSRIKSAKLKEVSNSLDKGYVKGRVNGGGTAVTISASSGTVYVD
jgi:DUF4097 and DUF4098 domain-containing protein YvlB